MGKAGEGIDMEVEEKKDEFFSTASEWLGLAQGAILDSFGAGGRLYEVALGPIKPGERESLAQEGKVVRLELSRLPTGPRLIATNLTTGKIETLIACTVKGEVHLDISDFAKVGLNVVIWDNGRRLSCLPNCNAKKE